MSDGTMYYSVGKPKWPPDPKVTWTYDGSDSGEILVWDPKIGKARPVGSFHVSPKPGMIEVPKELLVLLLRAVGGAVVFTEFDLESPVNDIEMDMYATDGPSGKYWTFKLHEEPDND